MGRGKQLTDEEKGKIAAYRESGLKQKAIAKKIRRSQNVVTHFLRNQSGYGKNMKGATYKATANADRRAILRATSNSRDSVAKIKQKTGVKASVFIVRRVIKKTWIPEKTKNKEKTASKQNGYSLLVSICRIKRNGKT